MEKPTVVYYATIAAGDAPRPTGLTTIRTRVHGLVATQAPDLVVVKPLEPEALKPANKRNVNASWFQTAEVRGVVLEAACAAEAPTVLRDGAAVSRTIGERKGKEYVADDAFWSNEVNGALSNKKFRAVVLMAISALREGTG